MRAVIAEQREREAILRDVELAEQDAEAEARVLEAREAAADHGAAAGDVTRTILAELRGEVDRTRVAKAELRAQEEELREYIAELRQEAPAGGEGAPGGDEGPPGGGAASGDSAGSEDAGGAVGALVRVSDEDSVSSGGRVLRDVSNASADGATPRGACVSSCVFCCVRARAMCGETVRVCYACACACWLANGRW